MIDFGEEMPSDAKTFERRGELAVRHEEARLRSATADNESGADPAHRLRAATRF
jgi:hypothetical protein